MGGLGFSLYNWVELGLGNTYIAKWVIGFLKSTQIHPFATPTTTVEELLSHSHVESYLFLLDHFSKTL